MTLVGLTPASRQQATAMRFEGAAKTKKKTAPAEDLTEAKPPEAKPSVAPTPSLSSRVLNGASKLWQNTLDAVQNLLQWFSKSLAGFAQWISSGSTPLAEATPTTGKVPIPPEPSDEEVDEAMDERGDDFKDFDQGMEEERQEDLAYQRSKIQKFDKNKLPFPDFLHTPQADYILEHAGKDLLNKPLILLGNLRDQRDMLQLLAKDPRSGSNLFSIQFREPGNERFNNLWENVKAACNMTNQPAHPMMKVDATGAIQSMLEDFEEVLPEGEKGTLFLMGGPMIQQALNALPAIATDHPRIRIIVAGHEKLPGTFKTEAAFQSKMLAIPAPTVETLMKDIQNDYSILQALNAVIGRHKVKLDPDGLKAIVTMLKDAGKQTPSPIEVVSAVERIAGALDRSEVPPGEKPEEVPVILIDANRVNDFNQQMQAFLKANTSTQAPSDEEGGAFFKTTPTTTTTFKHVIGQEKAVQELQQLAKLMRNYNILSGLKEFTKDSETPFKPPIPKLLIFEGPPGTGKTMSASAVANEAGVKFVYLKATDLINKYLGTGADRVKELFEYAYSQKPCLVFIDEIDALAAARDGGSEGSKELGNTLTALLSELEGLEKRDGVTTIVATNRNDVLDDAFKSRQTARITFKLPNAKERADILGVEQKLSGYKFDADVDLTALGEKADKFSGRQLAKLIERCASKVTGQTVEVLESFRGNPNPDFAKILEAMPAITQTMLSAELDEMLKEAGEGNGNEPDPDNFGFAGNAKRMREAKAREAAAGETVKVLARTDS